MTVLRLYNSHVLVSLQNDFRHLSTSEDRDGPRTDYFEIARKLGGDVLGTRISSQLWYSPVKSLEKKLRLEIVLALYAAGSTDPDSLLISTSEKVAIPLSLLFSFRNRRPKHMMIGHKLSSGNKTKLFNRIHLQKNVDQLICVCRAQVDYARQQLGFSAGQVHFIPDKVDERYFHPIPVERGDYILAVGQEQRDYTTLVRALAGTGMKLIIVASSPWSSNETAPMLLENVEIKRKIPYRELRNLYAGARLVVVPIYKHVDYAAGVNGVLEAMAMAKPLILSETAGIRDYIDHDTTGLFVPPGDPDELREVILELWDDPIHANRLGMNARQAVVDAMTMDHYVENIQRIALIA